MSRRYFRTLTCVAALLAGQQAWAAPPTASGSPPVYDTGGQGKSQAGATSIVGLENGTGSQCLVGSDSTCESPISGSFSASLGGFTPSASGARMAQLSVTTSDSSGTLPTGAVTIVSNTDTTNPIYCNVNGVAATTSDQKIPASSWFAFTIPSGITTLHCIATGGTVLANGLGGSGLPTGAGGGGGSSSGGGGNSGIALTLLNNASSSGSTVSVPTGGGYYYNLSGTFGGATVTVDQIINGVTTAIDTYTAATPTGSSAPCRQIGSGTVVQALVSGGSPSGLNFTLNGAGTCPGSGSSGGQTGSATPVNPTIQNAAYVATDSLGGLQSFTNMTGSALNSVTMSSASGQTTSFQVYYFYHNPTGSTCTDRSVISIAAADLLYEVTQSFTMLSPAGQTATLQTQSNTGLVIPAGATIYFCIGATASWTPTSGQTRDLGFLFLGL